MGKGVMGLSTLLLSHSVVVVMPKKITNKCLGTALQKAEFRCKVQSCQMIACSFFSCGGTSKKQILALIFVIDNIAASGFEQTSVSKKGWSMCVIQLWRPHIHDTTVIVSGCLHYLHHYHQQSRCPCTASISYFDVKSQ